MQKLPHRMFSQSLTRPKPCFVMPHILHPCVKVVRDSSELLFPRNFDQSWHPIVDMGYFKDNEIAMLNDAEHCHFVNSMFKRVVKLANDKQAAEAGLALVELIKKCEGKK